MDMWNARVMLIVLGHLVGWWWTERLLSPGRGRPGRTLFLPTCVCRYASADKLGVNPRDIQDRVKWMDIGRLKVNP